MPALCLDGKTSGWCPGVTTKAVMLIGVRTWKPAFGSLFHANSFCDNKQTI